MKQEHGTYQAASGKTVTFWKTSKGFMTVVDGEITIHFGDDCMSGASTVAGGLSLIGWG